MDRFSSWLTIALLADKRSATVIHVLLLHVVCKFGFLSELTIDPEKGFQSAAFEIWAESMGIRVRQPLAFNPTSNASGEVAWKHVETALTSDARFPPTQQRLNDIAFAWNTHTKTATQMSPFMTQFGTPAVSVAIQRAREPGPPDFPSSDRSQVRGRDGFHSAGRRIGHRGRGSSWEQPAPSPGGRSQPGESRALSSASSGCACVCVPAAVWCCRERTR